MRAFHKEIKILWTFHKKIRKLELMWTLHKTVRSNGNFHMAIRSKMIFSQANMKLCELFTRKLGNQK